MSPLRSGIEPALLGVAVAGYLVAWVTYWRAWRSRQEALGRRATMITWVAWIAQVAAFGARAVAVGHLPIYSAYEFTAAFAGSVVLALLLVERWSSRRDLGVALPPVALGILAYAWAQPQTVEPLIPIFRGIWLKVHVLTAVVAYASFAGTAAACALSLVARARDSAPDRVDPARLVTVGHRTAAVGFAFLTVSIASGAIWAEHVWGRFWSWDPKETWSLITWLIYAAYLHARTSTGWRGRKAAVLGIIGFLAVLMTYIGVDLVHPGQHDFLFWRRG